MHPRRLMLLTILLTFAFAARADDKKIDVQVVNGLIDVPEVNAQIKKSQGNVIWELVTPGYRFPANGIVIKAPKGSFTNCRPIAGGSKFQCKKAKHVSKAVYKYDVNVTQNGAALPTLDPYVNLE